MNRPLVVLKFGSSVLTDRDSLPGAVHQVYQYYRHGFRVLAVVSAIGRHTDQLIEAAQYWSDPPGPEAAVAELLATGEQQSAALLAMALGRAGVPATLLSADRTKLRLRGRRLDAEPVAVDVEAITFALDSCPVAVIAGFSGVHEDGGTALLGRGGTDLSAVFLADVLGTSHCRLVKDVNGIYEHDPARAAAHRTRRRRTATAR